MGGWLDIEMFGGMNGDIGEWLGGMMDGNMD